MKFSTTMENVEIDINFMREYLDNTGDNFDTECTMRVEWELDIEYREWGVKSITPYFLGFVGWIEITHWGDDALEDDDTYQNIDLEDLLKEGFQVGFNLNIDSDCITLQNCDIDMKTKYIEFS